MAVTLGLEAEFTVDVPCKMLEDIFETLREGLAGGKDIVGLDDGPSTIELRVPPAEDSTQLYQNLCKCVQMYKQNIPIWKKRWKMPRSAKFMRGGAFSLTVPVGIHMHFSNVPVRCFLPLHVSLRRIMGESFLDKVGPAIEMKKRMRVGYGSIDPYNALRIQSSNWVEWREPFSCLTPLHSYILIHSSKLIAEAVVKSENEVPNLEIARTIAPESFSDDTYEQLKYYTQLTLDSERMFDWTRDLQNLWPQVRRERI